MRYIIYYTIAMLHDCLSTLVNFEGYVNIYTYLYIYRYILYPLWNEDILEIYNLKDRKCKLKLNLNLMIENTYNIPIPSITYT